MNWWRRLFERPRDTPRDLVIAEAKTARIVDQAKAAVLQADRALREIRRLDHAPH